MKQGIYTVLSNEAKTHDVYGMVLQGDTTPLTRPGQFVDIRLDGFYLRRPISVCDWDATTLTLLYKTVGAGTETMAKMKSGMTLDLLVGLGNGFDEAKSGDSPLLIGGGVGVPPLVGLCKRLSAAGKHPRAILGFRSVRDVFGEELFRQYGADVTVTTEDGSYGCRGFATSVMGQMSYTYTYTCGPMPMLRAVYDASVTDGAYSFEERMGCGFGACMGCSCKTKYGNKRICKDGPVLEKGEIIW